MNLLTWKKFRITKSGNPFLPWKIQERHILFFFIKWWDTPSFAPPHYFETKDDAFAYLVDELVYNFIEIEKGGDQ